MSNNLEESENELNPQAQENNFIYSLLRDKEYIDSLYIIKKSIIIDKANN